MLAPSFDLVPGVVKRKEPVGVQTFVPQPSVERFDQRVVGRLAWPTEIERNLMEIRPLIIEPGSPWENGYCESFKGYLRNECLNKEIFYSLREVQILIEQWRIDYNPRRLHSCSRLSSARATDLATASIFDFVEAGGHMNTLIHLVQKIGLVNLRRE